jgi:hypothetical protein
VDASIGVVKMLTGAEQMANHRTNINLSTQVRLNKSQSITIGYQSEVQDFNAALLKQNLKINHLVVKNAVYWKLQNLGSYTEIYRSYYSDGNARNLVFTSLYKNLNVKPQVKFGSNFLVMNFAQNKPADYYSPKQYYQTEAFVGIQHGGEKTFINASLDLAGGFQFIGGETQSTWRTKLTLSKSVGKFHMEVNGAYSTITATQSNGFSHFQFNTTLNIPICNKPLFYSKIAR